MTEISHPGANPGDRAGVVVADDAPDHIRTPSRPQCPAPAAQPADPALIRIIARRVPWPSLTERPDRSGLRPRWDALCEETGETLVAGTEYPLADAAYALSIRGASGEVLVTMRHEGSEHDSFEPMPVRVPAAVGAKRAERRARGAALGSPGCEETGEEGAEARVVPAEAQAAPLVGGVGALGAQAVTLGRSLDGDTGSAGSGRSGGRP